MIRRYLPLARKLAWRYVGRGEPLEDLVQVANVGPVMAARRYDETRGVQFVTFACPTISGELKRHFRDHGWALHVPRRVKDRALEVNGAVRKALERTGTEPSVQQLARRLELDEEQIVEALDAWSARRPASLDADAVHESEAEPLPLAEMIGAVDDGHELVEMRLTRRVAMRSLSQLERHVLHLRYVEDRSQNEIAASLGVSQAHVSRVSRGVLEKLGVLADAQSKRAAWVARARPRTCRPAALAA